MIVGLIKPNEGKIFLEDNEGRVAELTDEPVYRRAQMGVGVSGAGGFGLPPAERRGQHPRRTRNDPFLEGVSGRARRGAHQGVPLEKVRKAWVSSFRAASAAARRSPAPWRSIRRSSCSTNPSPASTRSPWRTSSRSSPRSKNKNIGVIITDHNVDETLAITDRAYLLYEGKVLKTGSPEELAADPEVRKRYLGKHFRTAPQPDDRPPAAAGRRSAALRFGNRCRSYARVARHAAARIHTTTE